MISFLFLSDFITDPYICGFVDGVSASLVFRIAFAVYAWKRKCNRFRADFVTFLRKAGENAAGPYEIDRFENQISDCWCLPEAIRRRIIALLPPIRDYATQSFRSRFPAWQNSVSELETMVRRGEFDTFALFCKMPIRSACLAFLHAGWFGKD